MEGKYGKFSVKLKARGIKNSKRSSVGGGKGSKCRTNLYKDMLKIVHLKSIF